MTDRYVAPTYKATAFTCPHCGVYAAQKWFSILTPHAAGENNHSLDYSSCSHCGQPSIWVDNRRMLPGDLIGQPPSNDMPQGVQEVYNEARAVASVSNRAAAALLRVAVETLINELRPGPEKLNTKIGQMVQEGLNVEIQRMLDSVRVIGNDTLHRGQIDLQERPETVPLLMFCVNRIVERMITEPRQLDELYGMLPPNQLEGIRNRDNATGRPTTED